MEMMENLGATSESALVILERMKLIWNFLSKLASKLSEKVFPVQETFLKKHNGIVLLDKDEHLFLVRKLH